MKPQRIEQIPISEIECAPQVRERFDDDSLSGLAATLKEVGLQQPIRVRREGDKWIVVDGERRLRAAKLAGLTAIDAIIDAGELTEADIIQRQLVANCQHEDLRPLELARAIRRLMQETHWPGVHVAGKLGMSSATVSRLLTLLSLPEQLQAQVESGAIPVSAAADLVRVSDPAERERLADALAGGRLTRDGLAGQLRRARRDKSNAGPAGSSSRATVVLGQGRMLTFSGAALTLHLVVDCLEEALVKARKARTQGIELATFVKMLRDQAKPKSAGKEGESC